jgi:hypothetical protein
LFYFARLIRERVYWPVPAPDTLLAGLAGIGRIGGRFAGGFKFSIGGTEDAGVPVSGWRAGAECCIC